MKRVLPRAALLLAVLLGACLLVVGLRLGSLVRYAVEAYAPRMTGTPVRLRSAHVSLLRGRVRLQGLEVGNPPGFAGDALRLGEIRLRVEPRSLFSDTLRVRELLVDSPFVDYETGPGGSNLARLQKSVESFSGPSAPKRAKTGKERRFVVDLLAVRRGRVRLGLGLGPLGRQGTEIALPDILLKDVGKGSGGATAQQLASILLESVNDSSVQAVSGARKLLEDGAKGLRRTAEQLGRSGVDGASKLLKGLLR